MYSTDLPSGSETSTRSFFPALRAMALISFALLVGATALRQPPWVATLGGVGPLIWYHVRYLTPRAAREGLSQSAIDSVYYFGFLVTIAALGVSAVSLALGGGKESMETIAYQFGLGLLATGYAVFARMHLTSISTWVDERSPEALLDGYLKRTQELVTNVEMASEQFVTLTNSLMAKTERVTNQATELTERKMLALAESFDQQLRETLASGNQGLSDLRAMVSETSFREERKELVQSVKVTLEAVTQLNKSLQEFASQSMDSARATEVVRASADRASKSMRDLSERMEDISGTDGSLARAAVNFEAVQGRATAATNALGGVVEELADVGGSLGGVGTTFKNLKSLTTKAQSQLESLVASSAQLAGATEHIGQSAQKTQALAEGIDRLAAGLPTVAERVNELAAPLEQLRVTAGMVEQQLHGLPRPTDEAIGLAIDLKEALGGVEKVLRSANAEAVDLSSSTANAADHVEGTRRAVEQTAGLVNATLASIAQNATRTSESLERSTETLQRAVSAATAALEKDVQTSSRAASMFSDRLAQVAQNIIDETRKVQPA